MWFAFVVWVAVGTLAVSCVEEDEECDGIALVDERVTVRIEGLASEVGGSARLIYALTQAPTAPVTLRLQEPLLDSDGFRIEPQSLTFTDTADQAFVVTGEDNGVVDAIERGWVVAFDPILSEDPAWNCVALSAQSAPITERGCRDGVVEGDEQCEPVGVEDTECPYGEPACTYCDNDCRIQAGNPHVCGDGFVDNGVFDENCEPATFIDTCFTLGFTAGTAVCRDCFVDTSDCTGVCPPGTPNCGALEPLPALFPASHMCIVEDDGRARCWGDNGDGQAVPPADVIFTSLDNGVRHSCGIDDGGAIRCWGFTQNFGALPSGPFAEISVGAEHACALRDDGGLACFGQNGFGQTDAPTGNDFVEVDAGAFHSCARRSDDSVSCWGLNRHGQSTAPIGAFRQVATGLAHSCALRVDDGTLACWGRPEEPMEPVPPGSFASVTAKGNHTCALDDDGVLVCFGLGNTQGPGFSGPHRPPDEPLRGVSLDGANNGCGLAPDNTLRCWGHLTPHPAGTFQSIDAGTRCALATDGHIECWAHPAEALSRPALVPPAGTFISMSGGCALRPDRHAVCFIPINGLDGPVFPPVAAFQSVAVGVAACGILDDGSVICWGNTGSSLFNIPPLAFARIGFGVVGCGLLEDGTLSCWGDDLVPGLLTPPVGTYQDIAVGGDFGCALDDNGAISCWGNNDVGQCDAPTGEFNDVTASGRYACATDSNDNMTCWGQPDPFDTAVPAGAYTAVLQQAFDAVCALRSDNSPVCFGPLERELEFVGGSADAPIDDVAVGGPHTCALRSDQRALCWDERDGLFRGPIHNEVEAIAVGEDGLVCTLGLNGHTVSCNRDVGGAPVGALSHLAVRGGRPCALTLPSGLLRCWGTDGDVDGAFRPALADADDGPFVELALAADHVCALGTDGTVSCYGDDGDGESTPPGTTFVAVAADTDISCGVDALGVVACWGKDVAATQLPVLDGAYRDIRLGGGVACALPAVGSDICWGIEPLASLAQALSSDVVVDDGRACAAGAQQQLECSGDAVFPRSSSR